MTFLLCLIAFLQPVASQESDVDRARALFAQGTKYIEENNYQGALETFQASYRIRKKPIVLYNIAMCEKVLKRYANALNRF